VDRRVAGAWPPVSPPANARPTVDSTVPFAVRLEVSALLVRVKNGSDGQRDRP
jgi:hypothetical protein